MASRNAIGLLSDWLKVLVVLVFAGGALAGGAGAYLSLGDGSSHWARLVLTGGAAVFGGLLLATPYLIVIAVISLLSRTRGQRG